MIINNISNGMNFGMAKFDSDSQIWMDTARNWGLLTSKEIDKAKKAISTTPENDKCFRFSLNPNCHYKYSSNNSSPWSACFPDMAKRFSKTDGKELKFDENSVVSSDNELYAVSKYVRHLGSHPGETKAYIKKLENETDEYIQSRKLNKKK